MAKCRICNVNNPASAQRCESCGAWLDISTPGQDAASQAPSTGESAAAAELPPAPSDPLEAAVVDLMRKRRKIDAIKRYREATGKGLKDSKEAVEAIAARHGVADQGVGCGAAIFAAMLVLGGIITVAVRSL